MDSIEEFVEVMPNGVLRRTHLRRSDVVDAFSAAFQMIGGVPRLALWADSNPGEFFKLYARLLPSQASNELENQEPIRILHALPPPRYSPKDPIAIEDAADPVALSNVQE